MTNIDYAKVAEAIETFAYRLRRARRDAGELSLRELARRIDFRGSPSTLQRAFAGHTLPSWPVVQALLIRGFELDPDVVRREWLPRWVAVKDLEDPLDPPALGTPEAGDSGGTVVALLKPA